jgi:hypothetical protein
MFDGQLYLHQNILSALEALAFLIIIIKMDPSITLYVQKLGFLKKSSRELKFTVMFITMAQILIGITFSMNL